MLLRKLLILPAACVSFLTACGDEIPTGPGTHPGSPPSSAAISVVQTGWLPGMNAPQIAAYDRGNIEIGLSEFRGKFLLLEVGAAWCLPTRFLAPLLPSIEQQIAADGVDFTTVVTLVQNSGAGSSTQATVEAWLTTYHDGDYRKVLHVDGSKALENQWLQAIDKGLLPTLILIGPGGEIIQRRAGADSEEGILKWVREGIVAYDNRPPQFLTVTTAPSLLPITEALVVSGTVRASAGLIGRVSWGDGTESPLSITADGDFLSSPHTFGETGFYYPVLTITDTEGRSASHALPLLTVFDPNGTIVAIGTVFSPPEACWTVSCFGPARFQARVRHDSGTLRPTGSFSYHLDNNSLRFQAASLDWLLVNREGNTARLGGTGSIEGLSLIDDEQLAGYVMRFMVEFVSGRPGGVKLNIWLEDVGGAKIDIYATADPLPLLTGAVVVQAR
jgi:hypothetical protein